MSGKYIKKILSDYCVLDLETTGLSANYDDIIEIGILKIRGDVITDKYQSLVNPGYEIPGYITELTGITNEMLADQPSIENLIDDIIKFIGDDVIIGHNTTFDLNFIKKYVEDISNDYMDTMQLSRKVYPELSHHRLKDMVEYLSLSNNEHRSLIDCISTKELYDAIKNKLEKDGLKFDDLFVKKHYFINVDDIKAITDHVDEDNFFYQKHCVFTGTLEKMVRKDAMQLVVNVGGILDKSVTKETNYLILGNNDYCSSIKDGKSSKQKKAEKLKLSGQDIEIIDEDTFYNLLNLL